MKKYDLGKYITKDDILAKIPQEEIFEKYLGVVPDTEIRFVNPWREDINPDCRFYWDNRTPPMLKFHDFATGWNWDCFNVVQIANNCNFQQALQIIAKDFSYDNLEFNQSLLDKRTIISNLSQLYNQNKSEIKIKIRSFNKIDLEYWNQYYVDEKDLLFYSVYPISHAWLDNRIIYNYNDRYDIAYAYYFGNEDFKLYFPNRSSREVRFIHNNPNRLQGYNQLDLKGDFLIDTKSLKDVICMRKFDINAVAPMTETIMLSEKAYNHLIQRFNQIFVLKDRDRTGKMISIKMKKTYNTTILMFNKDEEKDFSDNLKKYGINYMQDYIDYTKNLLLWN